MMANVSDITAFKEFYIQVIFWKLKIVSVKTLKLSSLYSLEVTFRRLLFCFIKSLRLGSPWECVCAFYTEKETFLYKSFKKTLPKWEQLCIACLSL